mmetsp:Transcript_54087/g.126295  ORF Transcript_54087/g.126295 Transcript_54087/m.126295 type:complete len:332 (-) Transcript_54087:79-1074(-)
MAALSETDSSCCRGGKYGAGVACICFVALVWTLATVLKQVVFQDLKYNEPLIFTYVCNSCYALHFPLHGFLRCTGLMDPIPWRRGDAQEKNGEVREAMVAGLLIAPIWFMAQWTYSAGVASTSVTSSTVISTTSVVWTLLASYLFLQEKLTAMKVIGIICCMAGNAATLLGNDQQQGQRGELWGDILCLLAAMLYATYTTVLSVVTKPDFSVALLFGALGAVVMVLGAPLAFGLEHAAMWRMTPEVFGLLIFNGLFDNVLSQFAWAKAVQWTSPTAATVGLSLTIPLSIVADAARHKQLTGWTFLASALVVIGFICVTVASKPREAEQIPQ